MSPILKRELNDAWLSAKIPSRLDEQIRKFAKEKGVSRNAAVRYIIDSYFDANFDNSEHKCGKNEA